MNKLYIVAAALAILAVIVPGFTHFRQTKSLGQVAIPLEVTEAFNTWTTKYRKTYSSPADKNFRLQVFYKNYLSIKAHNSNYKKTYTQGLNQFADITPQEFASKLSGDSESTRSSSLVNGMAAPETEKPKSLQQQANFDWRNYLQQTSISGSTSCNDNYAWVGAVVQNADYYISMNSPINYSFSPQTYIDCSGNFGNYGCNGGWAVNCFSYSQQWGVDTTSNYPYYGYQRPCRATTGYFKNSNIYKVASLSNTDLYNKLASKKVISAAIDISNAQFYTGGVFTGPCTTNVNQGVVLVGAGIDPASSTPYWLILNTWGSMWGEGGYMRIARFTVDGNQNYSSCGLNMFASYPTF